MNMDGAVQDTNCGVYVSSAFPAAVEYSNIASVLLLGAS
jgi:hypothetical protein